MIDSERISSFRNASSVLSEFVLWRQGYSEKNPDPEEVTDAVNTANGALLDFMELDKAIDAKNERTEKVIERMKDLMTTLDRIIVNRQKEIKRLRSILASHKIKYKKR